VLALDSNPAVYPLLFETLRTNALESPLEALPMAAGGEPGVLPLWCADDNIGHASFIQTIAAHGATPKPVTVGTLDRLLASWPRVDLVKIDAEGAEEAIWNGMQETLARGCRLMMEVQMSRYADPLAFWRRIKERFLLSCFLDYDGLVKLLPEHQLLEGAHRDWMLWFEPA
jgi:FkbM family methyltransferase